MPDPTCPVCHNGACPDCQQCYDPDCDAQGCRCEEYRTATRAGLTVAAYDVPWASPDARTPVTVTPMTQRDKSVKWRVASGPLCLNRQGTWEHEPQPSSRTPEFFERCRFATLIEAITVLSGAQAAGRKE